MKLRLQQQKRIACISDQADIRQAFVKVGIGAEKKSQVISEKEKKITAYHEAGTCDPVPRAAGCGTGVQRIHYSYGNGCSRLYDAAAGSG